MAFTNIQYFFVAILVLLLPIAAKGNDVLSPFLDNLCDEVECGRGSCETGSTYPFNFRCDCDDGWRRTRLDTEQDLQFLPCTIPNCSVDYSCMAAPPPVQSNPPTEFNSSFFDPCNWVYCGEGTCRKNATRTHTCECNPGSSNLLNISAFPCYRDCALGSDSCERLGIRARRTSNFPSSSDGNQSSDANGAAAVSISVGKLNWRAILIATFATIFLK